MNNILKRKILFKKVNKNGRMVNDRFNYWIGRKPECG